METVPKAISAGLRFQPALTMAGDHGQVTDGQLQSTQPLTLALVAKPLDECSRPDGDDFFITRVPRREKTRPRQFASLRTTYYSMYHQVTNVSR